MGCSYYLTCKKCDEAWHVLFETGHEEIGETIQDEAGFHLDEFGNNYIIDADKLLEWITKHKEHGEIEFDIRC